MTAELAPGGALSGWRIATAADVGNVLTDVGFPVTPYKRFESFTSVNGNLVVTPLLTQQIAAFGDLFGLNVKGLGPGYGFQAEVSDIIPGTSNYHPLFYGTASVANTQFASDADSGVRTLSLFWVLAPSVGVAGARGMRGDVPTDAAAGCTKARST